MGLLAETKTRRKFSRDPNNTKWTRDTTTFGQKILRAQGWEPGQYLGAKDASHSEFHTAANASYIRVALKDDMKGLGYDRAKENEVTGLDTFRDILSRLNGKSQAEVESEQQARLQVKTHQYVEQRWGPMRFVRGGLLVGDSIQEESASGKDVSEEESNAQETTDSKKEKLKKRKAESLEDSDSESSDEDAKEKKKRRKEERKAKKLAKSTPTDASETERTEDANTKKEKKKKSKKDKARRGKESETEASNVNSGEEATESDEVSEVTKPKDKLKESKKSKKEKKDKKDKKEKRDKKDKKDKKKRKNHDSESPDTEMSDAVQPSSASALTTGQSTPAGSGASTPINHRNFVRSRFIAQKRQAFMNPEALKQILMVKAT